MDAPRRETLHNQHRRSFSHDYRAKGTYMVTIVVQDRKPIFGHIEGHAKGKPGTDEAPHMVLSELGKQVLEEETRKISHYYPMAEVWRIAIMPDHIHLLIRIREALPEGKHLGTIVRGFKTGCTRAWWALKPEGKASGTTAPATRTAQATAPASPETASTAPAAGSPAEKAAGPAAGAGGTAAPEAGSPAERAAGPAAGAGGTAAPAAGSPAERAAGPSAGAGGTAAPEAGSPAKRAAGPAAGAAVPEVFPSGSSEIKRPLLFEKGYHDRIINRPGMLENIKRYMAENPLRARIRQECRRLMERQLHLWIAGREYGAFGNLFLLKYPLKQQVFFHRRDSATGLPTETTETYRQERERLFQLGEEGTVLVTPGISKGERLVVGDALEAQLPLILLQKEPIGAYWKPSLRRFYACAAGRLLILAPWQNEGTSDYGRFHHLNDLAKEVCEATEVRIMDYDRLR